MIQNATPATTEASDRPEHMMAIAYKVASDLLPAGREVRDSEEFGEAILAMVKAQPSFNADSGSFSTYMYRVGKHAIFRLSRKEKTQSKYLGVRRELEADTPIWTDDTEESDMREELHVVLEESGLTEQFAANDRLGSAELAKAKRTAHLRNKESQLIT
jgi:hypothetical protein